jgi:hypothetical protein
MSNKKVVSSYNIWKVILVFAVDVYLLLATPTAVQSSPNLPVREIPRNLKRFVGNLRNHQVLKHVVTQWELPTLSGIIRPRTSYPGYFRGAGIPVYMVSTSWGSPFVINEKLNDLVRSEADVDNTILQANLPPNFLMSNKDDDSTEREEGRLPEDEIVFEDNDEVEVRDQKRKEQTGENTEGEGGGEEEKRKKLLKKYRGLKPPTLRSQQVAMAPMFLDYADAQSMLMEMKTTGYDVRITATSMARALRQSSHLGYGLPNSQSIDPDTGTVEGSYLRYKLVPSSRELYYASHCEGCERVGFFTPQEEEKLKVLLSSSSSSTKKSKGQKIMASMLFNKPTPRWSVPFELVGRRSSLQQQIQKEKEKETRQTPQEQQQQTQITPMDYLRDGKKGIPVFYAEGLKLKSPRSNVRSLFQKNYQGPKDYEIPMFLSYEDLISAWNTMRTQQRNSKKLLNVPKEPPKVEVFNYIDLITSIDREQHQKQLRVNNSLGGWRNLKKGNTTAAAAALTEDIENIVFIPSSTSVEFKEELTRLGSGKARLRPMR